MTYIATDAATGPQWMNKYGSEGYNVLFESPNHPAYFQSSGFNPNLVYDWPEPTDPNPPCWYCPGPTGLQKPSSPTQTERYCVHSPDYSSPYYFDLDLNFTDGLKHKVSFYCFDFDANYGATPRVQEIEMRDYSSGTVLHTITLSSFSNPGKYVIYNVAGHVTARFKYVSGAYNSVLSGYFFDPPAPTVQFLATDSTTGPLWVGNYGSRGHNVLFESPNYPAGFSSSITPNIPYDWPEFTDPNPPCWYCPYGPNGLQKPSNHSQSDRYCVHSPDFQSPYYFDVDLNYTDGLKHKVSFYCYDYDNNYGAAARTQQVDMIDPVTGTVLHSTTLSSFASGKYLIYRISGRVTARFTYISGAYGNSVISGYFLDQP